MAIRKIGIETCLSERHAAIVLDVRSPAEYEHAHVPGAISFPIFSNSERHEIGSTYKQISREEAIKLGLQAFGKNLVHFVELAEKLSEEHKVNKNVIVHCWRGGMRSAAMAWLLDLYGFKVSLLEGGYKAFRTWVLQQFSKEYNLKIVGGYTGSNKTKLLNAMSQQACSVIDLEALALHNGSSFGNLDLLPQPSQEQFENYLALSLADLSELGKPIWLEAESQRIGHVNLPNGFFQLMRKSPLYFIQLPFEVRLNTIVQQYGSYPKDKLIDGIVRIKKRLGGLEAQTAINFLMNDNVKDCFSILLAYYDRAYLKGSHVSKIEERKIVTLTFSTCNLDEIYLKLVSHD